jgi:hypothetical protein
MLMLFVVVKGFWVKAIFVLGLLLLGWCFHGLFFGVLGVL